MSIATAERKPFFTVETRNAGTAWRIQNRSRTARTALANFHSILENTGTGVTIRVASYDDFQLYTPNTNPVEVLAVREL